MPKKKKYMRLPNGYGSIRHLTGSRSLPYAVHPPATGRDDEGRYIRPKPLCYVPDWYTGFAVLSAYHAGTYKPGMELDLTYDSADIDLFCRKVLSHAVYQPDFGFSLEKVYKSFIEWKFGENAPKKLSKQAKEAYTTGWKYLEPIKDKPIGSVKLPEIQKIVNDCPLSQATRERIVLVAKGIYKYALQNEMCEKDPTKGLIVPAGREDEHGIPFSDEEISVIWKHKGERTAKILLLMIYSGFRVGALKSLETNTDEWYFKGGLKTAAGRGRIVPIHSGIKPFVNLPIPSTTKIRLDIKKFCADNGISDHTPHDCRHTFSRLCETYGVREADRKRMMGHSFGADITNGIYGHRTLEELREEIEKIKIPKL